MRVEVHIERKNDAVLFEITNANEAKIHVDGPENIGGENLGHRPMELILSALATCGAFEVVEILKKQRQLLEEMSVKVVGHRAEGAAARPFTHIDMQFYLTGTIKRKKAERALDLAMDKYCSVKASLHPDIKVTYHITINGES